ncbi:PQQ-binding-like beta-propeller repeat protein [Natrinema thermotolerans]|uniref:PQQ-binding-like beta-propeller repeat protein n=1 Tax=Natrinema thermotolerans TaxID=121872 RepID=A0AAF0T724_9EURY|nr:PQQ-binding-like beta-propeller repeat protein [Natrinema thermotolerans]QCC57968.1 dehydrogenase [Natrinema thermotolerans]WMT09064.1 PQQ-binding-like beta-propeller repeat protein [Natrinema thermotolerans]
MALRNDRAVQAAREIELKEIEDGYTLVGGPDEAVTEQHDTDRIPEVDVDQEMLSDTGEDPESWLMYGGSYEQHRATPADVITPENVADLELEYELSVGTGSSMEGTPIVVPGDPPVMYQTNGPNHMKAIDPREGEILWSYTYAVPMGVELCCDDNNRGAAVHGDTVYMTTLDSGVVALDRYTGEERWYTSTADHEEGYSATWAPVVHDGTIYTGSAGGEYGVLGFIAAIDAESGEIQWQTDTLLEDEWVGASREHGCGTSWMTPTIDEEAGVLYTAVANPGPDFDGTVRPGPNFPTCGTISLDLESGEFQWGFQSSPHDVWDYDAVAPRVLVRDVETDDGSMDMVVGSDKTGWVYMMDAESGDLHERSEEICQHINMWEMIPHISEDERVPFVPGAPGGNDWQPPSYNPETGLVYVIHQNYPQDLYWRYEEFSEGNPYWGGGLADPASEFPDEWNGAITAFAAVDPTTGERVWREWIESEDDHYMWGGSLSTATGLVFNGTQNGTFVAYDGETGDRLWEYEFDVPISASPMSWYDPDEGKQYVAVQVGGSGWLRQGPRGDTLAVFSMED